MGRAWDEAEAILRACDDLDGVMAAIRDAESPVEARRALKLGFGFTGRQAAVLLTLPVMSFTRSERSRLDEGRRARVELLADVTGVLPAVRDDAPSLPVRPVQQTPPAEPAPPVQPAPARSTGDDRFAPAERPEPPLTSAPPAGGSHPADGAGWDEEFAGVLAQISSAMQAPPAATPAAPAAPAAPDVPGSSSEAAVSPTAGRRGRGSTGSARRSMAGDDDPAAVVDEQIRELTDAMAELLGAMPSTDLAGAAWSDDPRRADSASGELLDSCGVDDATGVRTLLWHLRRSGLESVEGLFPFAEPLTAGQGFRAQAARFEEAMAAGSLGSAPGGEATWAGRLWPIAERSGYGYAVAYRDGVDAGSVWAYGGGQPLHRMWDSVVDLLVELYQALTAGVPCDSALAAVVDGRVVWTNLG